MKCTIALVEDNLVNRNTFLGKINQLPDFQVLFAAENGYGCLEELKGLPFAKLPEVIFMDIEMPGMDGIQTIGIAKAIYPQIHFIVLTAFDEEDKIFDAIRAGASGYLLKHEPASVLRDAVENVIQHNGAPMSPAIARKALQMLSHSAKPGQNSSESHLPSVITEREKEVLQYMVNGWDAKRISSVLDISVLTVRKHIANIYEKLHVNSKAEIMSIAHENKWFSKG